MYVVLNIPIQKMSSLTIKKLNSRKYEKIREGMTLDWDELMENKDTNEMIDIFMTKLNSEMNEHIPKRKNSARKNSVPLSEEIRALIRKKHRAWEKYMKHNNEENYKIYTRTRNKVKLIVAKERKKYEKDIAETSKSNCKNFWTYINSKRKTRSGISELHETKGGEIFIANSDQEKAEVNVAALKHVGYLPSIS